MTRFIIIIIIIYFQYLHKNLQLLEKDSISLNDLANGRGCKTEKDDSPAPENMHLEESQSSPISRSGENHQPSSIFDSHLEENHQPSSTIQTVIYPPIHSSTLTPTSATTARAAVGPPPHERTPSPKGKRKPKVPAVGSSLHPLKRVSQFRKSSKGPIFSAHPPSDPSNLPADSPFHSYYCKSICLFCQQFLFIIASFRIHTSNGFLSEQSSAVVNLGQSDVIRKLFKNWSSTHQLFGLHASLICKLKQKKQLIEVCAL